MPKFVLIDAFVSINGVDLSDHVESLVINFTADVPEITSMADITKRRAPGLKDFSVDVGFRQDFVTAEVDDTFFDLGGAAAFPIIIRPDSAVKSATNPEFTGNVILTSYDPVAGSVGDVANVAVSMVGDGTLTRAV